MSYHQTQSDECDYTVVANVQSYSVSQYIQYYHFIDNNYFLRHSAFNRSFIVAR